MALGGAPKSDHVTLFLRELKWLKINHQYEYEILTLTFKKIKAEILACGRSEPVVPGSIPGCDDLGFFGYHRVV